MKYFVQIVSIARVILNFILCYILCLKPSCFVKISLNSGAIRVNFTFKNLSKKQHLNTIHSLKFLFILLCSILPFLSFSQESTYDKDNLYKERYRPAFHFTPESGWMNDPNGMVYYKGMYHLYYQYVPLEMYGKMDAGKHWGHATSKNLIHWKHEPIAVGMHPVYGGAPSGNTAIDWENHSGLQKGKDRVFCCYFAQRNPVTKQSMLMMAYSTDGGMSFTRQDTPFHVVPEGKRRYDPDVFWYEKDKKWIMVVSEHYAKFIFFESTNLTDWKEFYTLDYSADYEEMWDCVDMYPIKVEEEPGITKWIISFSTFTKTKGRYTNQAYLVGDFDGKKFTRDTKQYQFFDQGANMYGGITWSEIPNNKRRIFIAWARNWRGKGNKIPTKPWWGAQTLPREVTLHKTEKGYRLYSQPVKEYKCLRNGKIKSTTSLPSQYEMEYTIDRSRDSKTILSNTLGEQIVFGYKATVDTFYFDRSHAGRFDRRINYPKYHSFKIESREEHLKIRVLVDHSMAEIFINKGEFTMSEQFFPEKPFQTIQMDPLASDLKIWKLENIWFPSKSE